MLGQVRLSEARVGNRLGGVQGRQNGIVHLFIEKLGRAWTWNRGIIVDMRLIHNSGRWLPARTKKKLRNSLSLCHGPMGFRQRSLFFSRNTHTKQAHTDTHTRTHTNEKKTKKQTKPQKGLPKQTNKQRKNYQETAVAFVAFSLSFVVFFLLRVKSSSMIQ